MHSKIICLFVLVSLNSLSQFSSENKVYVDSLVKILEKSDDQSSIADACLNLSEVYSLVDMDSVIYYARKAEEIAKKESNSETDPEKKRAFISILAGANNNIGYAQFNKGDLLNSLKSHKKALDLWKKVNNKGNTGQSLNNLGVVYRQLGEYNKALRFFKEALDMYDKVGDEKVIANTYNNMGGIYKVIGKDDRALECYKESLKLRRRINDERGIATTWNNIGSLYKKLGDLDSALFYFNEALQLIEKVGDQMGIAYASCNIGEVAHLRGDFDRANEMGQRALSIGQDLGTLPVIKQASDLLQRNYEKLGQWEKAYEMQRLNYETSLEIVNEETKKEALILEMQYQFDKQQEVTRINNEKTLAIARKQEEVQWIYMYFISFCFLIVAVFSTLLYKRFRAIRSQKEIIEKQNNERKIMLQEIHHRVKNNFQIISSLLRLQSYKNQDPLLQEAFQEAINRIHTVATIHEIIYKHDALDAVEAKKYLENLVSHLRRTFENKKVTIEVESSLGNLGIEQTIPLGIIVNELITNSFKHAFDDDFQNPRISIRLQKTEDVFELYYRDNGIGYDTANKEGSFGMELIETLLEQIAGQMEHSSEKDWNTCFKISFIALE